MSKYCQFIFWRPPYANDGYCLNGNPLTITYMTEIFISILLWFINNCQINIFCALNSALFSTCRHFWSCPTFQVKTLTRPCTAPVPAVEALPSRCTSSTTTAAGGQKAAPPPSRTYVDPPLTGRSRSAPESYSWRPTRRAHPSPAGAAPLQQDRCQIKRYVTFTWKENAANGTIQLKIITFYINQIQLIQIK